MKKSLLLLLLVLCLMAGLSTSALGEGNWTSVGGTNHSAGSNVTNPIIYRIGASTGGTFSLDSASIDETHQDYSGSHNFPVQSGESVTLTAKANSGYKFVAWFEGKVSNGFATSYDETNIKSTTTTFLSRYTTDRTCYAVFIPESANAKTYLRATEGGYIKWKGSSQSNTRNLSANTQIELNSGNYILQDSVVELWATPDNNYSFSGWYSQKGNTSTLVSTETYYTWGMIRDVDTTIYALFTKDHEHDWGDPNYTWSSDNSSVTATRTCTLDSSHVETETVNTTSAVTNAATCIAAGVRTYTATFTNSAFNAQTKTVEIPVNSNAHNWNAGIVTKAATCTDKGVMTYTCNNNSSHTKTEEIAALGHDWDNGTITTDPSCETTGIRTYTCQNDTTHTKTEAIAALGHNWSTWTITKEPTETSEGEQTRTCSRCGATETQAIPRLVIEYTNTDGDGGTWEKESNGNLKFTFKRNYNDDVTFEKFQGNVYVDGTKIDAENYTVAKGSLIVTLKQAYLDTLSTGKHTLTVYFTDYRQPVNATFTVEGKRVAYDVPKTGDDEPLLLWTLITLVGLSLVLGLIWTGKQRKIRK